MLQVTRQTLTGLTTLENLKVSVFSGFEKHTNEFRFPNDPTKCNYAYGIVLRIAPALPSALRSALPSALPCGLVD